MTFSLAASSRRLKPQRPSRPLVRRDDADLPFVVAPATAGAELLLDTCVYIDVNQNRTPGDVDELIQARIANHSTICLAELTHLFGRLDPAHAETKRTLAALGDTLTKATAHRLTTPSVRAFGEAGMLAGLCARLTGRQTDPSLLNDALIFLQAREQGRAVLTRNIADFDYFDQLVPGARLLLYRTVAASSPRPLNPVASR